MFILNTISVSLVSFFIDFNKKYNRDFNIIDQTILNDIF